MTDLGAESTSSVAAALERDLDRSVRPAEAYQAVTEAAKDIYKAASFRQKLLKDACQELVRSFQKQHNHACPFFFPFSLLPSRFLFEHNNNRSSRGSDTTCTRVLRPRGWRVRGVCDTDGWVHGARNGNAQRQDCGNCHRPAHQAHEGRRGPRHLPAHQGPGEFVSFSFLQHVFFCASLA